MSAFLLILSSPSGGGKTTVAKALLARRKDLGYSISATTRPPRANERDGVDYWFLTHEEFVGRRDAGDFLEWAEYSGHLYGTLQSEVDRVLAEGRHVVLDIEVQGAQQIRSRRKDVVAIFLLPPSAEVLVRRLEGRKSERPSEIARRLAQAATEVGVAGQYDYVVVNHVKEQAIAVVSEIIDAEARRTRHLPDLARTIDTLRRELAAKAEELARYG